jgi:NADH dehydrogenase FAD-containing subunit
LASEEFADKAWKKYDEIPALQSPEISFTQGRATAVDCERKIAVITDTLTGVKSKEQYDYLIVSTGLRRDWPTIPQALRKKEYLAETTGHARAARSARECAVVIGGGILVNSSLLRNTNLKQEL